MAITTAIPAWVILAWVAEAAKSFKDDAQYDQLLTSLTLQPGSHEHYTCSQGVLRYKRRICIGKSGALRFKLMTQFHDFAIGAYSRIQSTYRRINHYIYWPGIKEI